VRIAAWIAAAGLALLGRTAVAQQVTYDYDKSADFSRLKTYAWVNGTVLRDELTHKRIVAAVDSQMAAKGFAKVEATGSPDVYVAYHAVFDQNLRVHGGASGYRVGLSRTGTARVEEVLVGTLAVDLVDARLGGLLWRGIATKEVDIKADPEKRDKNINRATDKIFKHYPPQS
jgi:hypothetical protein